MDNKKGSLKVLHQGECKHNLTEKQLKELGKLTKSQLIDLANKEK